MSPLAARAQAIAAEWGVALGPAFPLARHSFVAPAGPDAVLKLRPDDDVESEYEAAALALWDGDGACRLIRATDDGRALLLERAVPGSDLSSLEEGAALDAAIDVARRLWRQTADPFPRVADLVPCWLEEAAAIDAPSVALISPARELFAELVPSASTLVHGDLHHHNILAASDRFVAVDPKPSLGEAEFDIPPLLWNPLGTRLETATTERRLARLEAAGLDPWRMRAWAVIRGAYLGDELFDEEEVRVLLALVG
jgi:streptomycin 6-kinase